MSSNLVEDITLDDLGPRFVGEVYDLQCGECRVAVMRLIAGRRGLFYGCSSYPACTGTHGAHPDGSPLGNPGDARTREARKLAHDAFDMLWKAGKMSRDEAYQWLSRKLKINRSSAHISRFDVETCERVIKLAKARVKEGIVLSIWNRLMGEDDY